MNRGSEHWRLLRRLLVVAMAVMAVAASAAQAKPQVSVDAGSYYTCALRADQTIACWGYGGSGRATPPYGSFTAVSAGGEYGCALRTDQTIACWGANNVQQLAVPYGTFTAVSAGLGHGCALRTDQTIACWGDDRSGQATPPDGDFTAVDAGGVLTCGVRADQTLACWGHVYYSEESGHATPPEGTFTAVDAGFNHACGIRTDQTIACWGDPGAGRTIPPDGNFTAVSAGERHACGVRTDQTIACWGDPSEGRRTPPGGAFTAVSADSEHACGVRTNQTIACWGHNIYGQATVPASLAGVMDASTGALGFASQPHGTVSAPQTVTITNTGGYKLEIYATTFTGAAAGDFAIDSSSCLGRVDPGESCTLTVRFAPQAEGERKAVLEIEATSAPNRITIELTGAGGPPLTGPKGDPGVGLAGPAGPKGDRGPAGAGIKGAKIRCKTVRVKRKKTRPRCRLVLKVTKSVAGVTVAGRTRRARSGRVVIPLAGRPNRRAVRAVVRGRDGNRRTIQVALRRRR